ncbi:MAG: flagellar biosynthetic protein FliR [Bdellovibrionia bacterium]
MFGFYQLPEAEIILFALVLIRISAFIVSCAVIGSPQVPGNIKILLSLVVSILMFPLVQKSAFDPTFVIENFISLTVREILIGLTLGFLTRLFFFAVSMTGDFIAVTIGLSSSQLFNPMSGTQGSSLEQFFTLLATLVFFAVNGHHILISGLNESFALLPVSELALNLGAMGEMSQLGQSLLLITLRMTAPIVVSILAVNIAMGILGRAVPQMNVLVTSIPVTIGVGFAVLFICLPLINVEMESIINFTAEQMMAVMRAL